MKAIYKKLLKIKNPVLIDVRHTDIPSLDKYRILYPDGKCEYSFILRYYTQFSYFQFSRSCFQESTLEDTVKGMERYDVMNKIVKIQEIK